MPECPRCRVAYLDGESHRCDESQTAKGQWFVAFVTLCGLVGGALCGALVLTVLLGLLTQSNMSGVIGIIVGGPVGGVAGAIVTSRNAKESLDTR